MAGCLNAIQKSMLRWNEMHPYSAAHAVQVQGALDGPCLRASIETTLRERNLARLALDCQQFTFRYESGPFHGEIQTVTGEEGPRESLVAEIERQLNLPFDCSRPFTPFKFLVVPAGDSFYLGVVYFHPAADAESIFWLLRDIVACYLRQGAWSSGDGFDLYPDGRAHLLRRHPLLVARKLLGIPAQVRDLRRSHRVPFRDAEDLRNGFVLFSLGPEELRSLTAAARSWNTTVNDVLMALLMKSLAPCAAGRAQARRRNRISLGCIVNLRKDLGMDSPRAFGVFLGSFSVTHEVPDGITLGQLASDLAAQTAAIKRHRLWLASPLELEFARFVLGLFSLDRRKRFYPKNYPLWGGITNMNLNPLLKRSGGDAPLDYFRGVSTGPATPMVLSATTVGDSMNLGLSYRTAVFARNDIESLRSRFREHLRETRPDA